MIIFICFGNILTILAVWRTSILRTVPNMYVVSLAVADLIVGGITLPVQIILSLPPFSLLLDEDKYFCLFQMVIYFVSVTTSVFSMGVIAVDRALYIGYPLHYNRFSTEKTAKVIIAGTWTASLMISIAPFYYNTWRECQVCFSFFVIPMEYQLYVQVGSIILVIILTSICYGYILYIARSKQGRSAGWEADMKLVKIFLMVFGLFIGCWTPLLSLVFDGYINQEKKELYHSTFFETSFCLSVLNSGMNFLVYSVKNMDFRKAIRDILCRKKKCINTVGPSFHRY
ncbi:hypothetical protein LOTGIDRAFT_111898 [Lottia gigantea]|uniref:G-protein coupled receptors family 1 profile domain-containing protein n=1 Tax=Lottia gigantea TaxID=225164 RepID=V4AVL0_LOTGI|nr:hypothetical protein LOTGIDRAFT_111898 [Lottia gigantea]ESP01368.1 hypothetical protein LOTGIDRAFT_111898 [Lottia gigantea]